MNPLDEILKPLNGGKILDVATGHGDFLSYLAKTFKDYDEGIGIDLIVDRIDEAKKKPEKNINFKVMNACKIEFDDEYFDTVAIGHSLHHLENIDVVLNEMKRVLKPGGLFVVREVFQTPETEKENSQRHVHHWWAEVDMVRGVPHYETFTPDYIRQLISKTNLKIEHDSDNCEEIKEEEMPGVVKSMVEKIDEYIEKLRNLGDHDKLIKKGERIKEIFQEQGITNEGALYIVGRK